MAYARIRLAFFVMLIVLVCWYSRFTDPLSNNLYGPQELELSPKRLLVQTLVEKNSSRANVPIYSQIQSEVHESPAPGEQERSLLKKTNGDRELLVCQGQTDEIQRQLKSQFALPQYVVDHVKTFVFFLGHGHSGHSIVASLMDSHPHMVISHEVDLFTKLSKGIIAPNKTKIFNAIWGNTVKTIIDGVRARNGKGYNLIVDSACEGRYADYIDVIGDKKGSKTVSLLWKNSEKWLAAFKILKSLNVTLKVILVLRNPYDVIASSLLLDSYIYNMKYSFSRFANIKKNNAIITFSPDVINSFIDDYFTYIRVIMDGKKEYNLDIIEIHNKDLILDPRGTLLKLCGSLGVTCSDSYLDICSNKIYDTESRTRHLVNWTDEGLQMVQLNIGKYSLLKEYTFDSL